MDTLNHVQQLRNRIKELEQDNKKLNQKLEHFESGSRKSMLNCHATGKENLKRYIDTYYRKEMATGDYFKALVDKCEPYSYIEIIGGGF